MKKLLVCLMVIFAITLPVLAETAIDVSSMTTDELLELRTAINTELNSRYLSDTAAIYSGTYEVGKDIKAGKYVFIFDQLAEGRTAGNVFLYTDAAAMKSYNGSNISVEIGEEQYIDLADGMFIIIDHGSGTLRSIATPEWVP